mmetsp:Transcript_48904/g.56206  ORF Transcript_48904/g.56206 Transcript_48904/m.56206 type:complete len:307 (-) Transcript_48904:596-1516(-)
MLANLSYHSQCDCFKPIKTITKGYKSRIVLAYDAKRERDVVLKIYKLSSRFSTSRELLFERESKAMEAIDSPFVVKCLQSNRDAHLEMDCSTQKVMYLAYDYFQNGSLADYVKNCPDLDLKIVRYYIRQLALGLQSIHQANFCHRDLKLENFLLDDNFNLKISDFGLSSAESECLLTGLGSATNRAPEVLEGDPYDGKLADIFAIGVLLFKVITKRPPWKEADPDTDKFYVMIAAERYDLFWKVHETVLEMEFDQSFKDLFVALVHIDPAKRPSLDEMLNHEWMQGRFATQKEVIHEMHARRESRK